MPEKGQTKILFLPVSSPKGMGEYARSTAIAKALVNSNPNTQIYFGLNKYAPYFTACEFPCFPFDDSPTLCTEAVLSLLKQLNPDLVVFDASGRAKQLLYCKENGIKTVFIAQHARKLAKGLSLGRIKSTDRIIVVQPKNLTGELGPLQKLKLNWFDKKLPYYVGPIFSEVPVENDSRLLNEMLLEKQGYIFVNSGGGGNKIKSTEGLVAAAGLFLELATVLSPLTDLKVVVVLGKNYSCAVNHSTIVDENVMVIDHCESEIFNVLVRNAHTAVLSGGSSLLQAISGGVERIVSVAVAGDQKKRIASCVKHYGIKSCSPELSKLVQIVMEEIKKPYDKNGRVQGAITDKNDSKKMENGLYRTVEIIQELLRE